MRDAFAAAGGKQDVVSGEIWVIPDQRVTFADYDEAHRTTHAMRYVLVMQGDEVSDNSTCMTVLACPLSSQVTNKRSWEDMIVETESPLRKPSIVKLQLIQPIPRKTLIEDGDYVGGIDDAVLDRMRVHLIQNLGIR